MVQKAYTSRRSEIKHANISNPSGIWIATAKDNHESDIQIYNRFTDDVLTFLCLCFSYPPY